MKKMEIIGWFFLGAVGLGFTALSGDRIIKYFNHTGTTPLAVPTAPNKSSTTKTEATTINVAGDYVNGNQKKASVESKNNEKKEVSQKNTDNSTNKSGNSVTGDNYGVINQNTTNVYGKSARHISDEDKKRLDAVTLGLPIDLSCETKSQEAIDYANELLEYLQGIGHKSIDATGIGSIFRGETHPERFSLYYSDLTKKIEITVYAQ